MIIYERKVSYLSLHPCSFVTASQEFCVDPNASWLPERLRKLQEVSLENSLLRWNLQLKDTHQGNLVRNLMASYEVEFKRTYPTCLV